MEPSVIPGDEMPDIYSINPYNITFPDELMGFVPDVRNYTEPNPVKSPAGIIVAISITALYSVICVVGLLGNILVMYGVVSLRHLLIRNHIEPHLKPSPHKNNHNNNNKYLRLENYVGVSGLAFARFRYNLSDRYHFVCVYKKLSNQTKVKYGVQRDQY